MQAELEQALNQQNGGRLSERDIVTILSGLPKEDRLALYDWQLIKNAVTRRIDERNTSPDDPWNQWFWYVMGFALRSLILLSEEKPSVRMSRQRIGCQVVDWINAVADEFSADAIGEVISRDRPKLRKRAKRTLEILLEQAERMHATPVARRITNILRCYQPGACRTGACRIKIHRTGRRIDSVHVHAQQKAG